MKARAQGAAVLTQAFNHVGALLRYDDRSLENNQDHDNRDRKRYPKGKITVHIEHLLRLLDCFEV